MQDKLIHKLIVSNEAKFDYEECLELGKLPKRDIAQEVEEYISTDKRGICNRQYFKIRYLDQDSGDMLMLFVYKRQRLATIQYWTVAGICHEECWSEEMEHDGAIRFWITTLIDDIPDKADWVEQSIIRMQMQKELDDECKRMFK